MKITCVTYNILKGYHAPKILENISLLINQKGVDLICLQEAEIQLDSVLPAHWRGEYFRNSRACNLAILWNTHTLSFLNTKTTLFPMPERQVFLWRFTNYYGVKLQRGALSASFSLPDGQLLRVSNIHLACEGDIDHRVECIKYLIKDISKHIADYEIVAGDFNTNVPSVFRKSQEERIEKAFGDMYNNVFPKIKWTWDSSDFYPGDGYGGFIKFFSFFRVTLKAKLDYVFSKNLRIVSAERLTDMTGSDHRPLIATFEI